MTKKDIVRQISTKTGYTQKDVLTVVDELFNTIVSEVKNDEISLTGFGKFVVTERAAREMRNPSTGEKVSVPAKKSIKFRPAKSFKDSVNS